MELRYRAFSVITTTLLLVCDASEISRFDFCGGQFQSPVELSSLQCKPLHLEPLEWQGHWQPREEGFTVRNTWHSAEVQYSGEAPVLRGGPLDGDYNLSQIHFHWGNGTDGSEHAMDGVFYGMEAHLVHFKVEYGSFGNASVMPDGLAVIALFFEISEDDVEELESMVRSLRYIRPGGMYSDIKDGEAMTWLENYLKDGSRYFTYEGSLTTPPCLETVTWIVLKDTAMVGKNQLAEFRKLSGHDGLILENRRSLQKLNGRQVFFCSSAPSLHLLPPGVTWLVLLTLYLVEAMTSESV